MKTLRTLFYRHLRPTLGLRLTLYFMIFGVIIGYFTFVLFTVLSTHESLRVAMDALTSVTGDLTGEGSTDFIPNIVDKRNADLSGAVRLVDRMVSSAGAGIRVRYYVFNAQDRAWKRLYLDRRDFFRLEPVPPDTTARLADALHSKIVKSSDFFYGRSDRVWMLAGLSTPESRLKHVLEITADRQGLDGFLRRHRKIMALFALGLLIVSTILGKIFAYRITKPIRKLSHEASTAASGNMDVRFSVRRRDEIGVLADSLNSMNDRIRENVGEIQRRIIAMETMNRIVKAVLSSISRNDLLDRVVGIVSAMFPGGSMAMVLRNGGRGGFDVLTMYRGEGRGLLMGDPFIPDSQIGGEYLDQARELSQMRIRKGRRSPVFVKDILGDAENGSMLNVPIFISDNYLGSLLVVRGGSGGFIDAEIGTITMLADQIGVALQSVKAFEEKEGILLGIMIALTKSIDAKSKWTAGHSERVARLAESLAIRANLGEKEVRALTVSAILHDIGKIAVPEFILDKPAALTEEEYEVIRQHPSVGAEIIYDIPAYENIVPGILYHHEQWRGGGYPLGLRGDEIPLNGRIIALADVYDAITADRPYRKGMGAADAEAFIRAKGGQMFDPFLTEKFLGLLRENGGRYSPVR